MHSPPYSLVTGLIDLNICRATLTASTLLILPLALLLLLELLLLLLLFSGGRLFSCPFERSAMPLLILLLPLLPEKSCLTGT